MSVKIKCTCSCHDPDVDMMHIEPCCFDGWIQIPDEKGDLTRESLEQWLMEIMDTKNKRKETVIFQGCLVQGGVSRSSSDLNLCNNPECVSCMVYHNLLKEMSHDFLKKDNDIKENENNKKIITLLNKTLTKMADIKHETEGSLLIKDVTPIINFTKEAGRIFAEAINEVLESASIDERINYEEGDVIEVTLLKGNEKKRNKYPRPNGMRCPDCGEELFDKDPKKLLSSPPKRNIICMNCGYKGYRYENNYSIQS